MTTPTSRILEELADREAIRECLYRYSRGVDRLDADMLRSAYWPDCTDNHMGFTGNAEEFIAWSFPIMGSMDQTMHMIGNVLTSFRGVTVALVQSSDLLQQESAGIQAEVAEALVQLQFQDRVGQILVQGHPQLPIWPHCVQ